VKPGQVGVRRHSGGDLECGIGAEGLVVVEILVAQGDGDDPLRQEGALVVDDEPWVTAVGDRRVECVDEAGPVGEFPED